MMRRARAARATGRAAVLVAAWASCAASGDRAPPPALALALRPPAAAAQAPLFAFHSGFWLNLHLRLHYEATSSRPPPPDAPAPPDGPAWRTAVEFYQQRFAPAGGFGVLFDEQLVATGKHLSALGSAASLSGVEPALASQLEAAAQLVRADWAAQDNRNRAWVTALEPQLEKHGARLRDELSSFYGAPWPNDAIVVDVSCFAGPVGAYTRVAPVHIVITSCNPTYRGEAAVEMIFHEASHALIEPIEKKIEAAAKRLGLPVPDQLWHAVLFYSTGEIVKRRLGDHYVPYATKNGLWNRGSFVGYEEALKQHWQPHLDGRVGVDQAVEALLSNLRRS
jgi:hypothetical protein